MSARKRILLQSSHSQVISEEETVRTNSPCFATSGNRTENWSFGDINYEITGQQSTDSFEKCYELAKGLVANAIHKPEELKTREIYGLSYYFDRMKDVRIVKGHFGPIKVKDYYSIAENICKSGIKIKKQSPFLCLDLTYITAFLHDGLGLDWGKDITVRVLLSTFFLYFYWIDNWIITKMMRNTEIKHMTEHLLCWLKYELNHFRGIPINFSLYNVFIIQLNRKWLEFCYFLCNFIAIKRKFPFLLQ